MNAAGRQRAFRARMAERGLFPVCVYVPREQRAEIQRLAEWLCADRDLTVGPARRVSTGRLVRVTGTPPVTCNDRE